VTDLRVGHQMNQMNAISALSKEATEGVFMHASDCGFKGVPFWALWVEVPAHVGPLPVQTPEGFAFYEGNFGDWLFDEDTGATEGGSGGEEENTGAGDALVVADLILVFWWDWAL
jgi:hypothetical protein